MKTSEYPMITVEEAIEIVLKNVSALEPVRVPLAGALQRVLAEDIVAAEDMPPFAASAKDGFAVIAADDSPVRRVVGEQLAGANADLRLEPGTAIRITTGAPLPPGADAVVMLEQCRESGGEIRLLTAVRPGDEVRPAGEDVARGQAVLARGTLLGPAELGLLAATGHSEVLVHPTPSVAVVSTGDELVEPADSLAPGQIRDANRYSLMAEVRQLGCRAIDLGIVRDRPGDLESLFERGLQEADATLTSGGVSMGVRDLIKSLLESRGTVHFGRVYTKPGKPVTFATVAGKPFFALPGFPVSALVTFEIYVRPALLKMAGHTRLARPTRQVTLRHAVRHTADRTEFQRAVVTWEDGRYYATTTGQQSSGRLLSMVGANALLKLPYRHGDFAAGEAVEAIIIGDIY
jgi:gephyrin